MIGTIFTVAAVWLTVSILGVAAACRVLVTHGIRARDRLAGVR